MTPQNVVDMLEARGVIDSGQAYDIAQDAVHNGKDILQVVLDYGIYNNEDEFWATVAEELAAEHFDLTDFVVLNAHSFGELLVDHVRQARFEDPRKLRACSAHFSNFDDDVAVFGPRMNERCEART